MDGFADMRLVDTSDQQSWIAGGLGKTAYGAGNGRAGTEATLSEAVADVRAQPSPDILAFASFRAGPRQRNALDLMEAYGRYQPVTTDTLRFSIRGGAFYPPVSLENEGVGWSSPWTLTPSAINSWVGEELRTIGLEGTVEWRLDSGALKATGAVFGWNEPAGALMADRGWALDDVPTGLFDRARQPNAFAAEIHHSGPLWEQPFTNIDGRAGWYAEASWRDDAFGKLTLMHYDNRANPAASLNGVFAWRTQFTNLGLDTAIGDVTLLAQAMSGSTIIAPSATIRNIADFQSAYLLAGWDFADYTLAGRVDVFATQESHVSARLNNSEHGNALTVALTWHARRWLRLTGEALRVDSTRTQRLVVGLPAQASETQLQVSARLMF